MLLRFPGQRPDEKIEAVIHKHWIIDLQLLATAALLGIPPPLLAFTSGWILRDNVSAQVVLLTSIALVIYLQILLLVVYVHWVNEELDLIIVTNERILSHEQIDLFHRQVCETPLEQVQDIKGTEKGFFGAIFHYGVLEAQTAASDTFFHISHARNPHAAARLILDIRERITSKNS